MWQILRTLAEERKKREIDPTLTVLREILMEQPKGESDLYAQDRMKDMYGLIERLTNWYDDVKRLDTDRLTSLLALGAKVTRFLETTDRIVALGRGRTSAKNEPKRE